MQVYVQLWKVRAQWLALSEQERMEFVYKLGLVIKGLIKDGAELVGFGLNDLETPRRVDYRYLAVWRVENEEMLARLDEAIDRIEWGRYFEIANARGPMVAPQRFLRHMVKL